MQFLCFSVFLICPKIQQRRNRLLSLTVSAGNIGYGNRVKFVKTKFRRRHYVSVTHLMCIPYNKNRERRAQIAGGNDSEKKLTIHHLYIYFDTFSFKESTAGLLRSDQVRVDVLRE